MHGAFLKKTLEKEKIGVLNLIEDEHYFTTLAFVAIDENGEREFSFSRKPGADTKLQADELNLELLQNCKIFHFGSLSLTAQPAHEATVTAVSHEYKVQLILDNQKRGERGHFDDSDGTTVLIVGYADPLDEPMDGVWVLFELDKHREFAYSANIQIYLRQILQTLTNDVYTHEKNNKEKVVLARRPHLLQALEERFKIDLQLMINKSNNL